MLRFTLDYSAIAHDIISKSRYSDGDFEVEIHRRDGDLTMDDLESIDFQRITAMLPYSYKENLVVSSAYVNRNIFLRVTNKIIKSDIKYHVYSAGTITELARIVNKGINEHKFVPQGSPTFCDGLFYQSVYREGIK